MPALAVAIGAAICLMIAANAGLQGHLGPVPTLVAVHLIGLVASLPLAVVGRRVEGAGKIPWYLWMGGLVGVVLLFLNNATMPVLGAGMTVALGVVGQLAASAAVDHFGFLGLPKRPLGVSRVLGLGIATIGVVLMAWVP
jgi:transporter family-2 protein